MSSRIQFQTMDNMTFLSLEIAGNASLNMSFPTVIEQADEFYIVMDDDNRDSLYLIIPITLIYGLIFITGCIGNISTCIVIARNKSMYSATNYYLFSLAISDFMLLISGVPMELYHIWYKNEFIFGEAFCILRNMINEMSANATVLTITAFTIERYVAICHPFLSHTMSKLSRAIKYIFLIWILSISFAVPQALQTGIVQAENGNLWCTVVEERVWLEHSFEFATVLFFFAPMSLITVLYILIGVKLRSSTMIKRENGSSTMRNNNLTSNLHQNTSQSTKRVLKMLVAVVICFFLCWAPFHAQRLVYMWAMNYMDDPLIRNVFIFTTYASGILYYVSTCVNPLVYNIMSNKFRQAFKETLQKKCCSFTPTQANHQKRQYRMLSRGQRRYAGQHESSEYSGSGKDEYSSSTQKHTIDTIATSRNTSLKQYKLTKAFGELAAKSPSVIGMGSSSSRINDGSDTTKCQACLSAKVSNSKIKICSERSINEIYLNILPPSATYVSGSQYACTSQASDQLDDVPRSFINVNVHEQLIQKSISGQEAKEGRRRKTSGCCSHITLKRCDSILHISIGNSLKIAKRHKRHSFMFANVWKLLRRRKSVRRRKCSFDSQNNPENVLRLSTRSLNLFNDDLIISINKRNHIDCNSSSTSNNAMSYAESYHKEMMLADDLLLESSENGANELECYMNEIKQREMR